MNPEPAEQRYADIIHLPRHRSTRHEPMPRAERAAQFASFAALSGHSAAIRETARLTDARRELSESARAALDADLRYILQHPEHEARITWFEPNVHKNGGSYHTITSCVKRLDATHRHLLLADHSITIPLDTITELEL